MEKNIYQTLYDPRFLTEHPSFTLRPAGTVTFVMGSVNSGSPEITETTKIYFTITSVINIMLLKLLSKLGGGSLINVCSKCPNALKYYMLRRGRPTYVSDEA